MSRIKSRYPFWLVAVILILSVPSLLIVVFVLALSYSGYQDRQAEKIIDKKFHQEISQVPQMKVKNFMLWEGDSRVSAEIANKGEVTFWYGKDGIPRIEYIGKHQSSYTCFYVDGQGNKTNYAYDVSLDLGSDDKFIKWFPFKIKNLTDLVNNYDSVVKILDTFPKVQERIPFQDNWGKREVTEKYDENFVLKQVYKGKDVWCDLRQ